jgi:LmbE family N-acetylglucosaminyl deacetylase
MATLVCFHAHPDDESIATGGTMAKAADEGHRVVLVVATRGEWGEPVPGILEEGEQLGLRRIVETHAAADALGAARVEFLGYVDSGMMDEPTNDAPGSFWSANLDHAANRLAAILREEDCDVLTVYDDHGGYGHPDHIQVHRVGIRAAEMAGVDRVFESTMNRDHIRRQIREARETREGFGEVEIPDEDELGDDFGTPEEKITHAVDVTAFVDRKRKAMRAHASQIADDHFFLAMPEDAFGQSFGVEWYIAHGSTGRSGDFETDLFADA